MSIDRRTEGYHHSTNADILGESIHLRDFWSMPDELRKESLCRAIIKSHIWHYVRNPAYRETVTARGIREEISAENFPLILRPTAQTFKSYIDILGTPFPQDKPAEFLHWLANQLSIDLPDELINKFKPQYSNLEGLLTDIEAVYQAYGLEVITSSGTSGRSTIMLRDQDGIDKTVESFYLAFQRYLGMQADHRAIFIMPKVTRIAMVRMAAFSVSRVGLADDQIHYTIPFPAYPDQVRIRAGRTYRQGFQGLIESRILNPAMNWINDRIMSPRSIRDTIELLKNSERSNEKVLLFGGWIQLHAVALKLLEENQILQLEAGSLVGTGGGMKELYPHPPSHIQQDIIKAIKLSNGDQIPIRDVYGMAEGNWAAMQCKDGNYHIPPWIYAVVVDDDGNIKDSADAGGILAFFDPYGGGQLFPAFFKTADEVRLINGGGDYDDTLTCSCAERGSYLVADSIQRVDLLDEAGCAAQV